MSKYNNVGNIFSFNCVDCEYNRNCYGGNLGNQYRFCQKSREKLEDFDKLQQENQELKKQLEAKESQQREFIELLKNEIEALEFCDNEFILSNHKKEVKAYKEILLKYKEIIDTDINVGERGDDK